MEIALFSRWAVDNQTTMASIYSQYTEITSWTFSHVIVCQHLNLLTVNAQSLGLVGEASLSALRPMAANAMSSLRPDSQEFARFYDFVHFVCRERNQTYISVGTAVKAWRMVLLPGVFPLLDHWCEFVEKNYRRNINKISWRCVLDMALLIAAGEDLGKVDDDGCFFNLVNEFVMHMMKRPPVEAWWVDCLCEKIGKMKMSRV